MAKALKTIGKIAGVVAVVATVFGNPLVAAIATAVAVVANIGAAALTRPPPTRGSVSRILVDPNAPTPYVMGEGLVGGVLRHDVAYGATLRDVPNPYRFMAIVYSLGPVESIEPRISFLPVSSYYNGFLFTDTQLGTVPESNALAPQWAGAPEWGPLYKLSGLAAIGWSFLFDRDGKRFASGIDPIAAYGRWVKVYDPRKDSTFPGGSGSHRLGNESTYEWSENPALHAGTYAYGRYQNGRRVFGIGMPADGIDWNVVAAWANVCQANGWTIFGLIFEPGDRWANLKDICYAGGAEPVPGGVLTFKYASPKVPLDTITIDDLVTDDEMSVVTMQPYRDRLNTLVPRYRSPDHDWEMIDSEPVVNTTFLADDGEEKRDVWPFNFVKDVNQAAELAAYRLFDSREISPITIVCKPRLRHYRPGDALHIVWDEFGLDHDVVILSRSIDPTTFKVTFELMTETPAKHAFCLGRTGVAPPTPAILQSPETRDEIAGALTLRPENLADLDVAAADEIAAAAASIAAIGNDAILSKDEKPEIRKQRDTVINEFIVIRDRAVLLDVPVANFDADYTALIAYLGGLDLSGATDTVIVRSLFNAFFTDYFAERQLVLDGIAEEAAKRATNIPIGNSNRIPYSRFEGGKGWAVLGDFTPAPTPIPFEGLVYIQAAWTFTAANQNVFLLNEPGIPVNPNERFSVSAAIEAFATAAGPQPNFWQLYFEYYTAAGTPIGGATIIEQGTGATSGGTRRSAFSTAPATARFARLVLRVESAGAGAMKSTILQPMVVSAGTLQVEHAPYSPGPNADNGADVTLSLSGPSSDTLSYTSTGTLDPSDQLPRTYVYTLNNLTGMLTSGVTWNYRIIEGAVNGFAASATLRSMSAISGAGQFALSDLGSNTAQVEIIGAVGGGSVSGFLQLTKAFAPPNTSGGGGGGPASASQSSGFSPVNSSSFATVSNELQVTSVGTTQTGTVNLTFSPPLTTESASTIEVQLERWDGSTWVSFGAAESRSSEVTFDEELSRYVRSPAVFNFSRTATVTAGTNQRIRVRARRSVGTISHSTAGTLTLSA